MKNLNTFSKKIVIILFFLCLSCNKKVIINDNIQQIYYGTRIIEYELKKNMTEKKSGTYIYPKLGTKISLKKGKLYGVFQIIENKDTLYFCNFINNQPVGKYIKKFNTQTAHRHFRTLPLKPNIDYGEGYGTFTLDHNKNGLWFEFYGNCTNQGVYQNNAKEGIWIEECYDETGEKKSIKEKKYSKNLLIE